MRSRRDNNTASCSSSAAYVRRSMLAHDQQQILIKSSQIKFHPMRYFSARIFIDSRGKRFTFHLLLFHPCKVTWLKQVLNFYITRCCEFFWELNGTIAAWGLQNRPCNKQANQDFTNELSLGADYKTLVLSHVGKGGTGTAITTKN